MNSQLPQRVLRLLRSLLAVAAVLVVVWSFAWVATRPLRRENRRADQVQLTMLHWGDKNEDAIVARLVAEFEEQNPDVRIVRNNVSDPSQLQTKLQTMLAAGEPPDTFYLNFDKVADVASKGLLADIEEFIREDQARGAADALQLGDFFPAVLDAFRYDEATGRVGTGTLVGLAKDFTTLGFYYNKDLFRKAGVEFPPTDGWTWEEFTAAARAIGKLPGCHGAEFVTWESVVRSYLYTYGLDVASPGFKEFHLTDPAVVAALDQLRSWFHDEGRMLLSAKTQLETAQEPFLSGRIGLAGPYGRWKVPTYRRIEQFDWDFAPLPHAAGRPPSGGVLTTAWAMSKQNKHPRETWRLMKYLCGPRGQERICETGLAIPSLKSVAYSRCFNDPARKPVNNDVYLSAALVARPIEWPADLRFADQLKGGLENVYKLGQPTAPELAAVARAWESNRTPTVFRASYVPMPWGAITAWILIPLGVLLAAAGGWWWWHRPGRLAGQEERAGLTMVSPWLIGFAGLTAFPIVLSLLLAFTRWSALRPLDQAEWVGLDNFRELLGYDDRFQRALYVTSWYALLAVPSSQIAALIAAVLMNREQRGIGLFRAIWYLPSVLAGVGLAIMWKWVFHHEHGLLKLLLDPWLITLGWKTPAWFERDAMNWGVPAFALLNLWLIGGTMMIYLAGLKGIPKDLYEAAEIDGATGWRRLRNVTLPLLSPVIFFNTIMAIIASFQIFTQVFVMTGGGPGVATNFYVYYVYKQAFDLHAMGYASAMAWLLLLLILALTLLVMRGTRRFVYYEALKT